MWRRVSVLGCLALLTVWGVKRVKQGVPKNPIGATNPQPGSPKGHETPSVPVECDDECPEEDMSILGWVLFTLWPAENVLEQGYGASGSGQHIHEHGNLHVKYAGSQIMSLGHLLVLISGLALLRSKWVPKAIAFFFANSELSDEEEEERPMASDSYTTICSGNELQPTTAHDVSNSSMGRLLFVSDNQQQQVFVPKRPVQPLQTCCAIQETESPEPHDQIIDQNPDVPEQCCCRQVDMTPYRSVSGGQRSQQPDASVKRRLHQTFDVRICDSCLNEHSHRIKNPPNTEKDLFRLSLFGYITGERPVSAHQKHAFDSMLIKLTKTIEKDECLFCGSLK